MRNFTIKPNAKKYVMKSLYVVYTKKVLLVCRTLETIRTKNVFTRPRFAGVKVQSRVSDDEAGILIRSREEKEVEKEEEEVPFLNM